MNDTFHKLPSDSGQRDDDAIFHRLMVQSDLPPVKAPAELATAVRGKLLGAAANVASSSQSRKPKRASRRKWIMATAAAALVVVPAVILSTGREQAWAQVAETLRNVPWIHMTGDSGSDREIWLSQPRDIIALRMADLVRFDEHRTGIRHEFHTMEKSLYRIPINNDDGRSFQSMSSIFNSIFRGEDKIGEEFAEDRIVDQKRRSVTVDGRNWIEYELTIERATVAITVVIRVDPDTNLPVTMRFSDHDHAFQFNIDYPTTGPEDIYALNVPRDLRIEDRMPSADLKQIAEILDRSREDLDNYVASVCTVPGYPAKVVYRKGDKWRFCLSVLGPDLFKADNKKGIAAFFAERPPLDKDEANIWWKQRLSRCRLDPVMICDGRHVYHADYDGRPSPVFKSVENVRVGEGHQAAQHSVDTGTHMLEFQVFPDLNSYVQIELTLDSDPGEGPEGSVLVTRSYPNSDPNAFQTTRYWLDPTLGYAVVKYEHSDCKVYEDDPNPHPAQSRPTYEFSEFQKSPQGIWYPTVVVRKNAIRKDPKETDPPGTSPTWSDLTTYYHLDFTSELSDDLFKP